MKVAHRLLLVAVAWWLRQGGAPTAAGDCAHSCGGVSVPYPFGLELEAGCASSPEFLLHCNATKGRGEQLQLGNITVRKISPEDSTMLVSLPKVHECYNENGRLLNQSDDLVIDLSKRPQYTLSDTRNSLTVLGCDTYALMSFNDGMLRSGCISYCNNSVELAKDNTCSGLGCCQASIPKGLKKLRIRVFSFDGHVSVRQFNPCGVAFVGDKRSFNMSNWTFHDTKDFGKKVDAVLDWMFGWDDVPSDIDECKEPRKYYCRGKCRNLPGNYTCEDENRRPAALAAIRAPVLLIGVGASASNTWKWRIRRINFRRNGGQHFKNAKVQTFKEAELVKATGNFDETKKMGEDGFGSVYRGKLEDASDVVIKKPKDMHKPLVNKDFKDELTTVMEISHKYVVKLQGICLETRTPLLVFDYLPNGTLFQHIHKNKSIILKSWKSRLKIAAEAALALKYMHSRRIIHGNINLVNILLDENYSTKVSDCGTSALIPPEHSYIAGNGIEGTLGYIDPEYLTNGKLTLESDVYSFGAILVELITGKKPTDSVTTSGEPVSSVTKSGEPISSVTESGEPISSVTNSGEPISIITESGEPIGPATTSEEEINIISYFVSSEKDRTLDKILPSVIDFKASSDDEMDEVKKVVAIAVKCLHQRGRKRPTMEKVVQDLAKINPSLIDEVTKIEFNVGIKISVKPSVPWSSCLSWAGNGFNMPPLLHLIHGHYSDMSGNCP